MDGTEERGGRRGEKVEEGREWEEGERGRERVEGEGKGGGEWRRGSGLRREGRRRVTERRGENAMQTCRTAFIFMCLS